MEAKLIKIDKNGSKHYEGIVECNRCGGSGKFSYNAVWGDTCMKCGGTGKVWHKWIERTDEYQAKLDEQRQARHEKERIEREQRNVENRVKWLENHGFTADGYTWVFLGNTYPIKEQIKVLGGKFEENIGWHIGHIVEGYDLLKVSINDVARPMQGGYIIDTDITERKDAEFERLHPTNKGEHIGSVGEKIEEVVKVTNITTYWKTIKGRYSSFQVETTVVTFKDKDDNTLVWYASTTPAVKMGDMVELIGTVKSHKEYQGKNTTLVTRCKLSLV